MIGDETKGTVGIFNSNTTLAQDFTATSVTLRNQSDGTNTHIILRGEDDNWDRNSLVIRLNNPPTSAQDLPITTDPNGVVFVTFFISVPGGFFRIDQADSGVISFDYNPQTDSFVGTFTFTVNEKNGRPAYSFTNGVFNVTGLSQLNQELL